MQTENIDSFIEFLYTVEEAEMVLTADQVQKLTLIQTKVSELVAKVNQNIQTQPVLQAQSQQQPVALAAVSERRVHGFEAFINEKIEKHGDKWLVKDTKGKKTLGTHPSKKKAIKQLQAIEISKKQAGK
jgi:DNA-directed RNA polymerase specialized sigma54-like protein